MGSFRKKYLKRINTIDSKGGNKRMRKRRKERERERERERQREREWQRLKLAQTKKGSFES